MSKCKCIGCQNCKLEQLNNVYFNINCDVNGWERRVATYVSNKEVEENTIVTPIWCEALLKSQRNVNPQKLEWHQMPPQVKWSDIKKGDIYHIPPFNNNPRQNIKILSVSNGFASYTSDSHNRIEFLYPSYTSYKLMVKLRNQNV